MADPEERDLLRRAALGDRRAFARLVDLVGPGLYRYAVRMVRDDADAEDCVQEALTRAWLALEDYRGEARVRTWLFGIQANVVRQHLRRRPPEPVAMTAESGEGQVGFGPGLAGAGAVWSGSAGLGVGAGPGGPEQHVLAVDLREALDRALAELPPAQREAWLLVTVERLSYAEAATAAGTSESALRGCLERARRTLEGRLAPWR